MSSNPDATMHVAAIPPWEKASFTDMVRRCINEHKTVYIREGESGKEEYDEALLCDFSWRLKGRLANDDHAWPTVLISMEDLETLAPRTASETVG